MALSRKTHKSAAQPKTSKQQRERPGHHQREQNDQTREVKANAPLSTTRIGQSSGQGDLILFQAREALFG